MTISGSSNCTAAIDGSGNITVSAMTQDTASITLALLIDMQELAWLKKL